MTTLDHSREKMRRQAAALADALGPLIDALAAEPSPEPPPPPPPGLRPLIAKAWAVAEAATRLENDRYSRGEIGSRRALERAAKELRTVLRQYWTRRHD